MPRILVLGGSRFLGRATAELALVDGYDVTTFRRGRTGEDVAGVEVVRGDRANPGDLARLAAAGPWDAVVDTSSFVPRQCLDVASALDGVASRYVLVSTVSVYRDWPALPVDERSPIFACATDAEPVDQPGMSAYAFGKAGCESAVREVFGKDRTVILRPGAIFGPHDYIGRLPWWLARIARGGCVLVPGRPDREIQPIDVRDVAKFAIQCVSSARSGTFNVVADAHETILDMLESACRVTGSDARLEFVTDEDWLTGQGVEQWTEIPLWSTQRPWDVDSSRAQQAGLRTRPVDETVTDTWEWMTTHGEPIVFGKPGEHPPITPERERALLTAWDEVRTGSSHS